ncbi:MAG: hypothetical protein ABS36_17060 [Acidobacteria bacterium SCN 69-37]|nr:MAG: hypothetical protein ABS36_17060 [Acidobacteria bacterium SCN 69-37]
MMTSLEIAWTGGLSFTSVGNGASIAMASGDADRPSPMQLLGYAVMGCMSMDVVHILERGRHRLTAMAVRFEGEHAAQPPRRYTHVTLHFDITTSADAAVVERAINLSKTTYCPVWRSLRPDIELTTVATVRAIDEAVSGSEPSAQG